MNFMLGVAFVLIFAGLMGRYDVLEAAQTPLLIVASAVWAFAIPFGIYVGIDTMRENIARWRRQRARQREREAEAARINALFAESDRIIAGKYGLSGPEAVAEWRARQPDDGWKGFRDLDMHPDPRQLGKQPPGARG